MVEIYKVIAFIPFLDQIFDDKNKNGSVKGRGTNNNQYTCAVILNLLAFVSLFLMIRKIDICNIFLRGHFVSDDNNLYISTMILDILKLDIYD